MSREQDLDEPNNKRARLSDEGTRRRSVAMSRVNAQGFYAEYHGHTIRDLTSLVDGLRSQDKTRSFVYLAGDSTLDNKHWLFGRSGKNLQEEVKAGTAADAVNGYEHVLNPPYMIKDVSYWVNFELANEKVQPPIACINCAVEESCISKRESEGFLDQDIFVHDKITEDDILVVDVGGNDVALHPTCGVIFNIILLLYLTPTCIIRCCPWLAPGMWYFIYMFRIRLRRLVQKLIAKRKPKKVIICMLYFLDEKPGNGWADGTLRALGYNSNPGKLQAVIRQVYSLAVSQIDLPGTDVVTVPLYEVLDGKDTKDYAERVEPSVQGGHKLAKALADAILRGEPGE